MHIVAGSDKVIEETYRVVAWSQDCGSSFVEGVDLRSAGKVEVYDRA
ncbi:MAG: hypothetical protein ABI678_17190 [Kofleriaceae bacterium]